MCGYGGTNSCCNEGRIFCTHILTSDGTILITLCFVAPGSQFFVGILESQSFHECNLQLSMRAELKKINRGLMGIIDQHSKQLAKTADDVKSNAACRG